MVCRLLRLAFLIFSALTLCCFGHSQRFSTPVKLAASIIKALAESSPRSEANFYFAASALVPSGTPFFPGGHYLGSGEEFAIGLESANLVAEVFASYPHDPLRARQAWEESVGGHAHRIEAITGDVA